MSETPTEATTAATEPDTGSQTPAAAAPAPAPAAKRSLEDSLAALDDATRAFVLGEVQSARSEAKNLRDRVKDAEPIVAQWRQLEEASKTELQRAQEAAKSAEDRATATLSRVATAELKAALTGVVPDPAGLIEDLNVAKFITADGNVDEAAIQQLRAKYAAFTPQAGPRPNPAQGGSAFGTPTAADQIREAEKAGDFKRAMSLKAQQLLDAAQNQ
jgi:chromosome segregation ATPase